MKCGVCGREMKKVNALFHECEHCEYMTDSDKPINREEHLNSRENHYDNREDEYRAERKYELWQDGYL